MELKGATIINLHDFRTQFHFEEIWAHYRAGLLKEWLEAQWLNNEQQFLKNWITGGGGDMDDKTCLLFWVANYFCNGDNAGIENLEEVYRTLRKENPAELERLSGACFQKDSVDYASLQDFIELGSGAKLEDDALLRKFIELYNGILPRLSGEETRQQEALHILCAVFSIYRLASREPDESDLLLKAVSSVKDTGGKRIILYLAHELNVPRDRLDSHAVNQDDFSKLLLDDRITEINLWPIGKSEYVIAPYDFVYPSPLKIIPKKIIGNGSVDYGNIKIKVVDSHQVLHQVITLQPNSSATLNTVNGKLLYRFPRGIMGDFQLVLSDPLGKTLARAQHGSSGYSEMSIPAFQSFAVGSDKTTAIIKSDGRVRFYSSDFILNSYNDTAGQDGKAVQVCVFDSSYLIVKRDGSIESNLSLGQWKDVVFAALTYNGTAVGLTARGRLLCNSNAFDVSGWENVASVSAAGNAIVGVTFSGRVLCAVNKADSEIRSWADEAKAWSGVKAVGVAEDCIIGIKNDDSLLFAGKSDSLKNQLSGKSNVSEVSLSSEGILIAYNDGSMDVVYK